MGREMITGTRTKTKSGEGPEKGNRVERMEFREGSIEGVILRPLKKFHDSRGWLCEIFRHDEVPSEFHPAMAYLSMTEPGVSRGPHEHVEQADYFCFLGPSNFHLAMWDNRPTSPSYRVQQCVTVGEDNPMIAIVPPGVVHGYKNVGTVAGLVVNCPNKLYKGEGKKELVDEIRHEDDPDSPFRFLV